MSNVHKNNLCPETFILKIFCSSSHTQTLPGSVRVHYRAKSLSVRSVVQDPHSLICVLCFLTPTNYIYSMSQTTCPPRTCVPPTHIYITCVTWGIVLHPHLHKVCHMGRFPPRDWTLKTSSCDVIMLILRGDAVTFTDQNLHEPRLFHCHVEYIYNIFLVPLLGLYEMWGPWGSHSS